MNDRTTAFKPADSLPEITSIFHDLRNPLAAIHGNAEILIGTSLSEPQIHRIARSLYGASTRMREMLDEFWTRYRGADRGMGPCELRDLIYGAADRIAPLAESQALEIVCDIADGLAADVDQPRMQRVLVNLFVNAIEVMPDGGIIRVTADCEGRHVVVRVRDTGPGIAPEIRHRLFQPFATAGKTGGLGLGLALSRQTVIDHGGDLWLDSTGPGACFAFSLPTVEVCEMACAANA